MTPSATEENQSVPEESQPQGDRQAYSHSDFDL